MTIHPRIRYTRIGYKVIFSIFCNHRIIITISRNYNNLVLSEALKWYIETSMFMKQIQISIRNFYICIIVSIWRNRKIMYNATTGCTYYRRNLSLRYMYVDIVQCLFDRINKNYSYPIYNLPVLIPNPFCFILSFLPKR